MDDRAQTEGFERLLSATLSRTIDFVKFAETKNAALLTFSSAWILGSTNYLTSIKPLSDDWRTAFAIASSLFCISAVLAVLSFFPKLALGKMHKDPSQAKALLYFGDAATYDPAAFRDRVRERYFPPLGEVVTRNYVDDLSIQIAVNSAIAVRKFRFFNAGACVALAAIGVLSIPMLAFTWREVVLLIGTRIGQ